MKDDDRARRIADFDQLGALQADLAPVLAEYFEALVKAGFKRREALALVRDYQGLMWQTAALMHGLRGGKTP